MNRYGVAIAADSAVTVSYGDGFDKVFSTNKLFALSKFHPVGIMIYGNALLLGVPWELLIKQYRDSHLADRCFGSLREYSDDFIAFLDNNSKYFPNSVQDEFIDDYFGSRVDEIHRWVSRTTMEKLEKDGDFSVETFQQVQDDVVSEFFDTYIDQFEKFDDIDGFQITEEEFRQFYSEKVERAANVLQKDLNLGGAGFTELESKLSRLFFLLMAKNTFESGNATNSGIVITGYGEDEIYPSLVSVAVEGFFVRRLKYSVEKEQNETRGAFLAPFAQREMVTTFMNGVSSEYQEIAITFLQGVLTNNGIQNVDSVIDEFHRQTSLWIEKNCIEPVINSVGFLPISELAIMAETLVNLTSFKRRVTPALETVGGPIDVAVITKGDGLIWIKRKHYFEREKNPHFFANYYRRRNNDRETKPTSNEE